MSCFYAIKRYHCVSETKNRKGNYKYTKKNPNIILYKGKINENYFLEER